MQVKKQQLELNIEQQTSSKLGKEHVKGVYCHLIYLTYMLEMLVHHAWNARLDESQAEINIAERSINNLICR